MLKSAVRTKDRIIAAVLAVAMLFTLIPFISLKVSAENTLSELGVTIAVTDGDTTDAIENASVTYTVRSFDSGEILIPESTVTTDENGFALLIEKDSYVSGMVLDYTVKAYGYMTASGTGTELASDSAQVSAQLSAATDEIEGVTVEAVSGIKYDGSMHALVTVSGVTDEDKVTYKVTDGNSNTVNTDDSSCSAVDAGTYSVETTIRRYGYAEKIIVTDDITVAKAQTDESYFTVTPYGTLSDGVYTAVYDGSEHNAALVTANGYDGSYTAEIKAYRESGDECEGAKLKDAEKYTVSVSINTDSNHEPILKSFTVEITPASITPTVQVYGDYNGEDGDTEKYYAKFDSNAHTPITIGGIQDGDKVSYSFNGTQYDSCDSFPKVKNAGEYTIKLKIERANHYTFERTYIITIGKIDRVDIELVPYGEKDMADGIYKAVYDGEEHLVGEFTQGKAPSDSDTVSCTINEADTQEIGKIKNAGEYAVKVTVTNNNYFPYVMQYCVKIEKADQTLSFNRNVRDTISFVKGGNADFSAVYDDTPELSQNKVSYSVSDEKVATVDENGMLTLVSPGIVTITASRSGNGNYNGAEVKKTVKICATKEDALILNHDLPDSNAKYTLGTNEGVIDKWTVTSYKNDNAPVITIDKTDIGIKIVSEGASGNAENSDKTDIKGRLQISDLKKLTEALKANGGSLDVKVTVSKSGTEDNVYPSCEKSYSVKISFLGVSEKLFYVTESKGGNETVLDSFDEEKWYNGTLKIKAADGYLFSTDGADGAYVSKKEYSIEAVHTAVLYFKDENGAITPPKTVKLKIDKTAPSGLSVAMREECLSVVLGAISFGRYDGDVKFEFGASDSASGLDKIQWSYVRDEQASGINTAEDGGEIAFGENNKAVLTVKKSEGRQYRGKIVFSAFDKAGNEAVWNDGYEFVIDTRTPVITLGNSTGVSSDKDRIYYGSEGVKFTISVNEANFYPDIVKIRVSKDGGKSYGTPFTLSDWECVTADIYQSSFTLTDEAEYKVKVECTDKSGNKNELTSQYTYVVDKSSSYIVATADGKSRTLKVTVREPYFTPSGIILDSFKATDINGNAIDRESVKARLVTALNNASNWSTGNSSNEHIFAFNGFDDGIYDIVLSCKDRSGNLSNKAATGRFAVDTAAPYGVAVSFSRPVNQFGREKYYNSNTDTIKVTFTAYDDVCGVDSFTWEYNRAQGASSVNKEKYEQQTVKAVQDKTDKSKFTATVTLLRSEADQIRGSITVTAADSYSNTANKTTDSNIIINDTVSPLFDEIVYSKPTVSGNDGIFYGKSAGGKIEARLTITEANFVSSEVKISVSKDGGEYTPVGNAQWTENSGDKHTAVFTLNGDGAYIIKAEYTDRSANKMKTYQSAVRVIDTVSPVISVKFDDNAPVMIADGTQYYAKQRTATVTITEHNFSEELTKLSVSAKDASGEDISAKVNYSSWKSEGGDRYTATVNFASDAVYTLNVKCTDKAGNEAESYTSSPFAVDTTAPEIVSVEYGKSVMDTVIENISFGFYNAPLTVTVTARDDISRVSKFVCNFVLPSGVETKGFTADENGTVYSDGGKTARFTFTVPQSVVQNYDFDSFLKLSVSDRAKNSTEKDGEKRLIVDNISPEVTVTYTEPVSRIGYTAYYDGEIGVTLSVDEANFYPDIVKIRVSKDGGKSYGTPFTLSEWNLVTADIYQSSFTLTDEAEYKLKVECADKSGNKNELTSQYTYVVDKSSSYIVATADGKSRTLKVTVREPNFTPTGIILDSFKATDINGNAIDRESVKARLVTALKNASNWTTGNSSDEHIFSFNGFDDGIYDIVLSCKDRSGNVSNKAATGRFAVDTAAPYGVAVSFSQPVNQFGREKYYNSNTDTIKVTFTAYDDVCGVDSFTWEYNRAQGASSVNKEKYEQQTVKAVQDKTDKSKFTATVTLLRSEADQIRGSITVTAADSYSNTANKTTDSNIIINDTVSPLFDEIVYSKPTVAGNDGIFYGKSTGGKIEARLTITEANFVSSEVKISVSKDGGEYTSVGNAQWTENGGDRHTAVFTLNGDGAYIIKAEYTDRSANKMKTYQSAVRVIDTVSPVISVKFDDNIPVTVADGTQYYAKQRTATVTITEHNFSEEQAVLSVSAKDASGEDISAKVNYSSWKSEGGDRYTATVNFASDAVYTLNVKCTDKAGNEAESYTSSPFAVDTTAPEIVSVEYGKSVMDTVIENITFGFYNAPLTVTVTARDDISRVSKFVCNFVSASGVETKGFTADENGAVYSDGGKTARFTFTVPQSVVQNYDFDSFLKLSVSDRAKNSTEKDGEKRLIVDNISPEVTVSYTEPVSRVGYTAYYDGDIGVTLSVDEANFYPEDVTVKVNADSQQVSWTDNGNGHHTGTFTLSQEGISKVTVSYTDRSGNKMTEYVSDSMAIDTTAPTNSVTINGAEAAREAYTGSVTIGISANDTNIRSCEIASLKRAGKDKNEELDLKAIDPDFISAVVSGDNARTQLNIPESKENDGIYSLTVKSVDKAGNESISEVTFVICSFGSVYRYDDTLVSLINRQYIGDTSELNDIVVTEYSAVPVGMGSLSILITRDGERAYSLSDNDGMIDVREKTTDSGWYEYEYVISKDIFAKDGSYELMVSSVYSTADSSEKASVSSKDNTIDSSDNAIDADYVRFTVDTSPPEIRNIANLDKSIVNARSLDVYYTVADNCGIAKIEVYLDGNIVDTISGGELADGIYLYDGSYTVQESEKQQVFRLAVTDLAGNVADTADDDFTPGERFVFANGGRVTVSTNLFVRLYANKWLFWGSIAVIIVLIGAVITLIIVKRRSSASTPDSAFKKH